MTTVVDVDPNKLIETAAHDLKTNVKFPRPDWTLAVKTGSHKERQPESED